MMPNVSTLDELFARALRGCSAPWPVECAGSGALKAAERRLLYHGIAGLLNDRQELLVGWPCPLLDLMRQETLARAMWELRHATLASDVIEALHNDSVPTVMLKGTALAYSLYANPALRFRGDSDLLVAPVNLKRARGVLAGLGWKRPGHGEGLFGDLHFQEVWQFVDPAGLAHDIDLHWEVTNSRALRAVLDVHEVLSASVPLPALSPNARAPDPVTALIHRAVNRAEHARSGYFSLDRDEYDPNRLLWAKDIDILTASLSDSQWDEYARRALEVGVGTICAEALAFAAERLNTKIPAQIARELASAPLETPATRFIEADGELERFCADLGALPGLWLRLRFLLARTFPSPSHMRAKYPGFSHWPVATLYIRRLIEAVRTRILKRTA